MTPREVRRRRIRTRTAAAGLALALLAVAAIAADRGLAWHQTDARRADGDAAVAAARSEVVALTSVSAAHASDDIARILAGATGSFRREFASQSDAFSTSLTTGSVASTGRVTSAGLVSLKGEQATVLVAASGTVRNKQSSKPGPRNYRLRAVLQKERGAWRVSRLEFVP